MEVFSVVLGIFTLRTTPEGIPLFKDSLIICWIKGLALAKLASQLKSQRENPIAGIPSIPASMAALIVPE